MPVTRVMNGLAEFLPGQVIGRLRVARMVSRRPEPRYEVVCDVCQTAQVVTHTQLRNGSAHCRFSGCGKSTTKPGRDLLAEERQRLAQREAERAAEELEISERRMAAETEDWERPTRYAPTPDPYQPMSERERLALRERREAEEAAQREAERPARENAERIAALQAEQENTLRQLHAIQRERIATGKDEEFSVDPATIGEANAVPPEELPAWQSAQFAEFLKANPDYYRCDENASAVADYLERNAPGLRLISAVQLTAAYKRLDEFGLLQQRPTTQSQEIEQPRRVNLSFAPKSYKGVARRAATFRGRDYVTGREREFTEREIARMSSAEYARAFPVLTSVSELFTALADEHRQ